MVLVLAVGCSSSGDPDPVAESNSPEGGAARSVPAEDSSSLSVVDPSPVLDAPGVNPEGVINAAVLLHSGGDVDAALAQGAFSRVDLDAARAGLEDGSLGYLFE